MMLVIIIEHQHLSHEFTCTRITEPRVAVNKLLCDTAIIKKSLREAQLKLYNTVSVNIA